MDVVDTKKNHLWSKGVSGNPAGRPKGSKNAISLVKLQIEGELRAQMKGDMTHVMRKIMDLALEGDKEMLKLLFKSWVSGTVASDEDAPKDKIQIVIGKLDQMPEVKGRTISNNTKDEQ
jgi:hypothetical protein